MALKAASVKVPAQRDAFFLKGLLKYQKYLVTGFNALLLTCGSIDSQISSLLNQRQSSIYPRKLAHHERMLSDLLHMFNEQYQSGNANQFVGLRLTLIKVTLTFLAMSFDNQKVNLGVAINEQFLLNAVDFLQNESNSDLFNSIIRLQKAQNDGYTNSDYIGISFTCKHFLKMIMVQIIEKSINQQISAEENQLFDIGRAIICNSGLLEH